MTSRTWKGRDRAGEQRAAHRRRPADTRPGVRSAAQRVAGGAPQPDRLRRPGRSSSRRLRCCRKVAPPLLHDRPLRLRPDGAPPAAATMTAAAAPAVGKKDLACCRREPTARAEEHSPEAACVTCSCRSRRWATFKIVRQVIRGLCRAAPAGTHRDAGPAAGKASTQRSRRHSCRLSSSVTVRATSPLLGVCGNACLLALLTPQQMM